MLDMKKTSAAKLLAHRSGPLRLMVAGAPAHPPVQGKGQPVVSSQPTARHLAQMRGAAVRAGLTPEQGDAMAEAGVTMATAEAAAQGLAHVAQMVAPHLAAGRLDAAAVAQITRRALKAGAEVADPAQVEQAIVTTAGAEAVTIMAAAEPQGRTVAPPVDLGGGTPARAMAGGDTPTQAERMADGLMARMLPGHVPTHGREFATMRLSDMSKLAHQSQGYLGRSTSAQMLGAMGTDDFDYALAIASNKVLLDSYEAAETQLKKVSRQVTAPDFRPINTVRVSNDGALKKVGENAEIPAMTINDAGEAFAIETFSGIARLTRQALVNDETGGLETSARNAGNRAALTEAKLFAGLITKNGGNGPTMADGKTLFHADHGNVAAAGSLLSIASLSVARTAMRRQKGISGEAITVQPAFLIVPPELETDAEALVATITANTVADANPFIGKLTVLVDANLESPIRWYVAAQPGRPDGLLHAYLDGNVGPQFFTREGFDVDATEFKVRLDFGCGFVDHRAWYMNPGAAQ